jgi:alpha-D-xyloside xylohydrolase
MGEFGTVLQNEPVDVSEEFSRQENHFFAADRLEWFDPDDASGEIHWKSLALKQRVSYHQLTLQFEDYKVWEDLPPGEYEDDQNHPFDLSFVTPRTVRLRLAARPVTIRDEPSLMLDGEPPTDDSWKLDDDGASATYRGRFGSVTVVREPARFEFRDAAGRLLTRTHNLSDTRSVVNSLPTPLSFVRLSSNLHRLISASFLLSPGEKLFGGGESFTRLDKRGQKLVLWTHDAYSAQTPSMYKPVPFFVSSRGYGMFVHTSVPLTRRTVSTSAMITWTCSCSSAPRRKSSPSTPPSPGVPRPRPSGRSGCGWGGRPTPRRTRSAAWRRSCARTASRQT